MCGGIAEFEDKEVLDEMSGLYLSRTLPLYSKYGFPSSPLLILTDWRSDDLPHAKSLLAGICIDEASIPLLLLANFPRQRTMRIHIRNNGTGRMLLDHFPFGNLFYCRPISLI